MKIRIHPYTPLLLLTVLVTFILTQMTGPNLALGSGLGLISGVVSYRTLEDWHCPDGHSEERRVLLYGLLAALCILVSGPQGTLTLTATVCLTFAALMLAHTLQPPGQGTPEQGQEASHAG